MLPVDPASQQFPDYLCSQQIPLISAHIEGRKREERVEKEERRRRK
jgi:hypothetical protein